MITSVILYLIYGVVYTATSPLRLLDDVVVNSNFIVSIANAVTYLKAVDNYLPISELSIIIGLVLSIELALATYKIVMWIIRRLPTQS